MARRDVVGVVYLIHFDSPLCHARHYLGWSERLEDRIAEHRAGRGSRLMSAVNQAGIAWSVSRTWTGTRALERNLHRRKASPRLCPICRGSVRP